MINYPKKRDLEEKGFCPGVQLEGATVYHGRKTWQQAEKASALRKLDVNKKWVTV